MTSTDTRTFAEAIVTLLQEAESAKSATSDNPLSAQSLIDLMGGVRKGADNYPARINNTIIGMGMEAVNRAGLDSGRVNRLNRRKRAAHARTQRRNQIEALAAIEDAPPAERVAQAWLVIVPLVSTIEKIARLKTRKARRYLGDLVGDVVPEAQERMMRVLAWSDQDLTVLERAATEIGLGVRPSVGDATDIERKFNKKVGRGRRWLMATVNNCVMKAIDSAYRSEPNVRWQNIDMIPTIMDSVNGSDEDAFVARFKADRAPAMSGWRWAQPGSIDHGLISAALAGAISDRGLDAMVELFLREENCYPSGGFRWRELAHAVFLLAPDCDGEAMWQQVVKQTEQLSIKSQARAQAARRLSQHLFSWVPGFIVDIVPMIEDMPFGDGRRYPLVPALSYATPQDAALAITEVIA